MFEVFALYITVVVTVETFTCGSAFITTCLGFARGVSQLFCGFKLEGFVPIDGLLSANSID